MREIKFRAWYANQEMHYGIAPIDNKYYIFFETQKRNAHDLQINRAISIMQYTGLKDKNGKEIYEGDIVNVNNHGGTPKYETVRFYTIAGFAGIYPFTDSGHHWASHQCEIVGNIFQDGDLLRDS